MIPFIDLKPLVRRVAESSEKDWVECLEQTQFIGGAPVEALERELAQKLKTQHAIACANGTDALLLALQAVGIGRGDRVAVPNLTFWASLEVIAQVGAEPVLIDCDPVTLQMDFQEYQRAHREYRLKGAILVHLMGWATPELDLFRTFSREAGIALIEDGAQSFGVEVKGESVFAKSLVSTLSFYPAKVIGGAMDGGAVLTNDPEIARRVRSLANHGRASHYSYEFIGWNSRMSAIQGKFLRHILALSDEILAERRARFGAYLELLGSQTSLKAYQPPQDVQGNGYLSVWTHQNWDGESVATRLKEFGVGTGRVYPETMDAQPPCKDLKRVSALEHSREFCSKVFNLPLYFGMTVSQQNQVVEAVQKL